MTNKTIHGYSIKHLIGSGGMADVYYAENKLGKKAAIKVLKAELCAIGTIKERFEQEARIMVDIEHKHIRQAYDLDEVNGQPAIIMEYLEGHTLKQLIDKGKISDEKAKKYFEQCVSALRVAHAREIVHRDIKPSNIFITRDDDVKILDFGIAKVAESGLGTRTNQMLGTPLYMSPEQIKSPKNVGTKSDVYSLAVTFYHALTGKVPYDNSTDSDFEIQSKIVHEDLDLSRVSSLWGAMLRLMLIKDPNQRIDINALSGKGISEEATQYDYKPEQKSKSEIELKPNLVERTIPKWIYNLLGGVVLALAVIVGLRNCGIGDKSTDLIVYEDGGKYGYKDNKGTVVVNARFDTASPFSNGRGKVSVADSVYYIDEHASIVEVLNPIEKSMKEVLNERDSKEEVEEQNKQENTSSAKPYTKMISIPGHNFKMSETEVTIGQYLAFCEATNSHWPKWLEKGNEYNIYTGNYDDYKRKGMSESNTNHPITGVSALDADAFCKWMGGRLPTESEWEYAAKGGENYEFAGSNNLDEVGWYPDNSGGKVSRVKQLKANGYDFYDMSGNVWEWTSSKEGGARVFRGGSWNYSAVGCLISYRVAVVHPSAREPDIGFRIASYK